MGWDQHERYMERSSGQLYYLYFDDGRLKWIVAKGPGEQVAEFDGRGGAEAFLTGRGCERQ